MLRGGIALGVLVLALMVWRQLQPTGLGDGFVSGNGRIEAVEIDIAAKAPGRIKEIVANEGDFVTAGQIVATMDMEVLESQKREAQAQLQQAHSGEARSRSLIAQREAEKTVAAALVAQRQADLTLARQRLARTEPLEADRAITLQELDEARAGVNRAVAALHAARAQVTAADAAVVTAQTQEVEARAMVDAAQATVARLQADLDDGMLKAPRDGRVQYRVAQVGEVLGAGGKVLTMLDLSDVYMTFFLPTSAAGRLSIGAEARLVLDAYPQYVIPARISFVASSAQFTPKTVETASEREKLMFRVKAQIDPALLRQHIRQVKTGLPGMAYARLDPAVEWPAQLHVALP